MDGYLGRHIQAVEYNATKWINSHIFNYDSFLDVGFESVAIGIVAALTFGVAVGAYSLVPFLPATNLLLFIAFAVPLTGSTHYDSKLGTLTFTVFIASVRATQLLTGIAPATMEFLKLALVWGIVQVFLIGFLPGKVILTSEHLGFLTKGLAGIAVLYASAEYLVWSNASALGISESAILAFPLLSFFLIAGLSSIVTFIFANTFCPYMMIPIMSRNNGARYCGSGNHIYDIGTPVKLDQDIIERAGKRGFKLVSELPAVTVFNCSRGGIISVYKSGKMLIRKVNKGTAERIKKNFVPLLRIQ